MTPILILVLAAVTLLSISLQKTYNRVTPKELKRRARQEDPWAKALYRVVAYGVSLRMLLWIFIAIAGATFFVTLARFVDSAFVAVLASAVLIWFGFLWLPESRVTSFSTRLAAKVTPGLEVLLRYLHPIFERIGRFIERHRPVRIHTGLYQKDDLVELINQQQVQIDNRITKEELELAAHALVFGDKLVRDHLTPRRVVKMVSAADSIGPVLMGELHNSGHSRFPVFQDNQDSIVGTLYMRDLVDAKAGGRISDVMKKAVYYVHEERPLHDALQAFLKTKHHMFIVVNSFEEYVGIISIEDVLEQIIGKPIIDEFDQYDDMRAVARRHAAEDSKNRDNVVKSETT